MTPRPDLVPLRPGFVARDCQKNGMLALRKYLPDYSSVLLSMSVGSGKGDLAAAALVKSVWRGQKCMYAVHRETLLDDVTNRARLIEPDLPIGLVRADRNDVDRLALFASIPTLSRDGRCEAITGLSYLIYDEAHHAAKEVHDRLRVANPGLKIIGVTGTPYRPASNGRTSGLGHVFDVLGYEYTMQDGIDDGVLAPLEGISLTPLFAPGVDDVEANKVLGSAKHDDLVVAKHLEHRYGQAIAFCTSVGHALRLAEAFNRAGVKALPVWDSSVKEGHCPDPAERIAAARRGDVEVLTNFRYLIEGVDIPSLTVAHMVRRFGSLVEWGQGIGRVNRIHPSKRSAYILDYGDNVGRLNLASAADMRLPVDQVRTFDPGDVVRHRYNLALSEGVVESVEEDRAVVEWRGAPTNEHPMDDLALIRKGRSTKAIVIGAGLDGLREMRTEVLRSDPSMHWYRYDPAFKGKSAKTWTARAGEGPDRLRVHVREERDGWQTWALRKVTVVLVKRGMETREEAQVAGNGAIRESGLRIIRADPTVKADAQQRGRLKHLGIKRDTSDMIAWEASLLGDAIETVQRVRAVVDPSGARRAASAQKRWSGKKPG